MLPARLVVGGAVLAGVLPMVLPATATASNANVAALQVALKSIGLYRGLVDGVNGPLTDRAVRRFQGRSGLPVDGTTGPRTRRALGRRGRPAIGTRVIQPGRNGWDVAALQFMLLRRGFSPGPLDGIFGRGTRRALIRFQRSAGIGVDGVAGPATIAQLRKPAPVPIPVSGPIGFLRPVAAPIGDRFGARREGRRRHAGVDFPAPRGTQVVAAGAGTTIFAGWNSGGYGNLVVVQHRLGHTTWYAHLREIQAWVGESVVGGSSIGLVGSTGNSTGPHLHFEIRRDNVPVDPESLLGSTVAGRATSKAARRIDYARVRLPGGRD